MRKIMTILGTRPEMIKMSEIIKQLDKYTNHVFVHTGQNYDRNLQEVFYDDLGLRRPDYNLKAVGDTLGDSIGKIIQETEKVLQAEKPEAVVIHGDTNSSLASIVVKRMKIPLFHLEAGNRCFDDNVPEEVNRRLVDHISDVNMVYSENSRRHLLQEGLPSDRIFLMGSPMAEVLRAQTPKIRKSRILKRLRLKKNKYYLVSVHRDENLEIKQNLINVLTVINTLAEVTESLVVMSVHPRTEKRLVELNVKFHKNVILSQPFNFSDYIKLQTNAKCVISDSGTISEESAILGFPAITIRNAIERPEAIDNGSIIMSGLNPAEVLHAVSLATPPKSVPSEYKVDNCSERVLRVILGYVDYINHNVWKRDVFDNYTTR